MISVSLYFHSGIMFCELLQRYFSGKKNASVHVTATKYRENNISCSAAGLHSLDTRQEVRNYSLLWVCFFNWMHRLKIHNNVNIVYQYIINPNSSKTLLFWVTWLMILMHIQNKFKLICKAWSKTSFKKTEFVLKVQCLGLYWKQGIQSEWDIQLFFNHTHSIKAMGKGKTPQNSTYSWCPTCFIPNLFRMLLLNTKKIMQKGFKDVDSKISTLGNFTIFKQTFSDCA